MKKVVRYIIFCGAIITLLLSTSFAGKICDYTYEGEENNIIVANREAGKRIALTFDDGPCVLYTKTILDILEENDAKATFFVIGKNAKEHPELLKEVYISGHEIGNHTLTHPNLRSITKEKLQFEISETNRTIKEITGTEPVIFRPPGGYLNNMIVECIEENNCRPVLWSWRQDTEDWKKVPASTIAANIIKNLKDGDIILFHDYNSKGSPTPEALRIVLPKLKSMGYSFVTVSEMASIK